MCLILFANRTHPEYPLVIAANRDETYARPTAPAAFWEDDPRICAGRDLEQGGTWLGVTRGGAFAAVTNFRSNIGAKNSIRSRGELVANYLRGRSGPSAYVAQVRPDRGLRHDQRVGDVGGGHRGGQEAQDDALAIGQRGAQLGLRRGPCPGDAVQAEGPVFADPRVRARDLPAARVGDEPARFRCSPPAPRSPPTTAA